MSKRILAMLASVATLAMLAAGCGGSDDEALTKAEFIEQGKAICADVTKEVREGLKAFAKQNGIDDGASKEQMGEAVEEVVFPALRSEVDQLAELSPPEGDEEQIEAILTKLEDGIEDGEGEAESFLYDVGESQFFDGRNEALEYGLAGCAAVL